MGSTLDMLHQAGASRALFPGRGGAAVQAITINTAGGITGGDRFSLHLTAGAGSALRVATQAAERIYRAEAGETAHVDTRASVAAGARLDWLPQETIVYDGAALRRSLRIELAADARLLLVEPLVFGRAAMGETLRAVDLRDRIEVTRGGLPLYLDAFALGGDATAHLARRGIAGGAGAMASLVLVAPDAESHLAPLRALMPITGGVSLIRPDVLVLRLLGRDAFDLRRALVPALTRLTGNALPRSWMT